MKERELRKHSHCDACRNLIGACGMPLLWRVTVERYGIDMRAVRRQDGLAAVLGSPFLAQAMGPDEDMAVRLMTVTLTVCEACGMDQKLVLLALAKAEQAEEAVLRG